MRVFTLLILTLTISFGASAQTLEELQSMQAEKSAAIGALQAELDKINAQIDAIPMGWKTGGVGIIGANFAGNDNWFAIENPYSSSIGYGLNASAFANRDEEKYFWNNLLNFNIQQVNNKIKDGPDGEETELEATTDALDLSSLFGYKLSSKWAVSAEGKYSTSVMQFNDPGKLVASAGATWTPIANLVVLIHPLGFEVNFPGELVSAAGAKIGATYAANILPNVAWSSNLSAFVPYSGGDGEFTDNNDEVQTVEYGAGDIMNWTWINGFSTTIWKGIGVGLNVGLRQDRQIADKYQFSFDGSESDNPLQVYYNLGLSYTL